MIMHTHPDEPRRWDSRPVRRLILVAALSLLAFIALSLTSTVNATVTVTTASGLQLLLVELFWLSAAATGASFATLLAVGWAVERRRDVGHEIRIWAGVLIGVMAGFILVSFLPVRGVPQLALAVVGAFLASTVFRITTGARSPVLEGGGGGATED